MAVSLWRLRGRGETQYRRIETTRGHPQAHVLRERGVSKPNPTPETDRTCSRLFERMKRAIPEGSGYRRYSPRGSDRESLSRIFDARLFPLQSTRRGVLFRQGDPPCARKGWFESIRSQWNTENAPASHYSD